MFHTPAFLVLSGFFTLTDNPLKRLNNMLRFVLIPYIIFEAIYLIGLGILGKEVGANNKFEFTLPNFIDKICFSPIGTYWYLHTLVICASVYILFSFPRLRLCKVNALVCSVIVCFSISVLIDGLQWVNCIYFFVGAYIRILCKDIKQVILPSVLSLLGVVILCFTIYERDSLGGLFITLASLSFLFSVTRFIPKNIVRFCCVWKKYIEHSALFSFLYDSK